MAEDDPKCISELDNKSSPHRWGRHHKGAKKLATLYSTGEHVINIITVATLTTIMLSRNVVLNNLPHKLAYRHNFHRNN